MRAAGWQTVCRTYARTSLSSVSSTDTAARKSLTCRSPPASTRSVDPSKSSPSVTSRRSSPGARDEAWRSRRRRRAERRTVLGGRCDGRCRSGGGRGCGHVRDRPRCTILHTIALAVLEKEVAGQEHRKLLGAYEEVLHPVFFALTRRAGGVRDDLVDCCLELLPVCGGAAAPGLCHGQRRQRRWGLRRSAQDQHAGEE